MQVTLLPTSDKLRQRIQQFGQTWTILLGPIPMPCFNNELGLHIESQDKTHRRNVRLTDIEEKIGADSTTG